MANVCGYSKGMSVKDKVEIYIWNTGGCLKRMKWEIYVKENRLNGCGG